MTKSPPLSQLILDQLREFYREGGVNLLVRRIQEEGCPTSNAFAEALWHLLSGNHGIPQQDALFVYTKCGYLPFKGLPLQRREATKEERDNAYDRLCYIVDQLGIAHTVDLLSTICWQVAEAIKKHKQGGNQGINDSAWRNASIVLGNDCGVVRHLIDTAVKENEGARYINPLLFRVRDMFKKVEEEGT